MALANFDQVAFGGIPYSDIGPAHYGDVDGIFLSQNDIAMAIIRIDEDTEIVGAGAWMLKYTFSGTIETRIETVVNGLPTGTLFASGAKGIEDQSITGNHHAMFDSTVFVPANTVIAVGYRAGTGTGQWYYYRSFENSFKTGSVGFPYVVTGTSARRAVMPNMFIVTKTQPPGVYPISHVPIGCHLHSMNNSIYSHIWASTDSPVYRGVTWVQYGAARMTGFYLYGEHDGDFNWYLYDSSYDAHVLKASGSFVGANRVGPGVKWDFYPIPPTTLINGHFHELIFKPTTTTRKEMIFAVDKAYSNNTVSLSSSIKSFISYPGGTGFEPTDYTVAEWFDRRDTTQEPLIHIAYDQFDDSSTETVSMTLR